MTLVSGDITSGEMTGDLTGNSCITILVGNCQMTDCYSQEGASKRICSAVDSSLTYVT